MPQHPSTPDEVIVARALDGDVGSYGVLVTRHQHAALRLAAAICGSTEEARDIVQDAFVKGHRSLGQYRHDAPVRSWLLRLVANEAKNALRARDRRRAREQRFTRLRLVPSAGDVADGVADADEATRVLAALRALALSDREVLACRFVAGLSETETATALSIPVGTVKSRTARALDRARELLDGNPPRHAVTP